MSVLVPPWPEEGYCPGGNGILFVSDKGKLSGGSHVGVPRLIPETAMKDCGKSPKTLLCSPNGPEADNGITRFYRAGRSIV